MAYSKVRWFSMPAFLACVGGVHGREEGANVCEGARTAEVGAQTAPKAAGRTLCADVCAPRAGVCAPEAAVCTPQPTICAPPTGVCTPQSSVCAPLCRRMRPSDRRMRPSASRMRPQQPRPSNVAAMWQPPWTK
jgi:hypothetical protein